MKRLAIAGVRAIGLMGLAGTSAAQALPADGNVFTNLGFNTIDLGTFTTPPIPPGTELPITLIANLLLPTPPVPLANGQFQ